MTGRSDAAHRKATAVRAAATMTLTLAAFAASGAHILAFFGISLGAFRIAGGILLLLLSVDMLRAEPSRQRSTPEERAEGEGKADVSVFPLAIPMLSGPGAVATVMMLMTRAHDLEQRAMVFGAIGATGVVTAAVLLGATFAERRLGKTGMRVLERVMGLLLAAVAVQFVVDGVRDVLPQLAGRA